METPTFYATKDQMTIFEDYADELCKEYNISEYGGCKIIPPDGFFDLARIYQRPDQILMRLILNINIVSM